MHTDSIPADRGTHRMGGPLPTQGDGRKPLPHIVTGLLSIALTLVAGHFSHVLQGPAGAKGLTTVITKPVQEDYGFCLHYDQHQTGIRRFQLAPAIRDGSGAWCKTGTFISVVPGATGK